MGDGGVLVSPNNGGGLNFSPATLALNDFGYDAGWRLELHLRFLADVTGDRLVDIVSFGENHVYIGRNNGDETVAPAQSIINNFCLGDSDWQIGVHPRFVADLMGDGRADIIGYGDGGSSASLNNGSSGFGPVNLVVNDFRTAQGWQVAKHPRFIADLTGDKSGDVIGFGNEGAYGDGTGVDCDGGEKSIRKFPPQ